MSRTYEDRLVRVLAHIEANPDGDLSLDALAEVAAMSRFHWHRVFVAVTGETLSAAIRRSRLYRAAGDLVNSDLALSAIAERAGYGSARSFARAFRHVFGTTPGAFRREGRLLPLKLKHRQGDYPMYPIDIETCPGYRLGAVAHTGAYTSIGGGFDRLSAMMSARGLWPQVRGMVGVYYDDPDAVAEAELRSHAGVILADGMEIPEGLEDVRVDPGPVAVMRYKGPYSGLHAAYKHLYGTWLPASGREPRDAPPFEIYRNSPQDTKPEDLLTDVHVPIMTA